MIVKTKYIRNYTLLIIKSLCQHHLMRHCTNKRHYLKSAAIQGQFCCISERLTRNWAKFKVKCVHKVAYLLFCNVMQFFASILNFPAKIASIFFLPFFKNSYCGVIVLFLIKISWNWRSYAFWQRWKLIIWIFPPLKISPFLTRWCKVHAFWKCQIAF